MTEKYFLFKTPEGAILSATLQRPESFHSVLETGGRAYTIFPIRWGYALNISQLKVGRKYNFALVTTGNQIREDLLGLKFLSVKEGGR